MNKISLIIKREYLTRVKKRSFIVMTILGPILMASIMIIPIWLAISSEEDKSIAVIDETGFYINNFQNSSTIKFTYLADDIEYAKSNLYKSNYYAILYIPEPSALIPTYAKLYSKKEASVNVKTYIQSQLKKEAKELALMKEGIDLKTLEKTNLAVTISSVVISEEGIEEEGNPIRSTILGIFGGILIYFFIFMFGVQVMRGVIEEKTSRIVEVIISSVKPFQLMMGKIIGIAMVGLTQFSLWALLTAGLFGLFQLSFADQISGYNKSKMEIVDNSSVIPDISDNISNENNQVGEIFESISSINFGVMIVSFMFYFLFGYLLYAALFAGVGSAVDSEADTQQFMLPITIPLILTMVLAQVIAADPQGPVAIWLSMIPLTSPIAMMIRIPFGVDIWTQIVPSVALLILGFLGATWIAAKIYKTGILMYGKKTSYKELWKWIRYKN
ncbi:MAG: ABC transporter permease [Saprospiraceae bacterium]|nr:ABC transporter permease [Saprospiraceae bacterium]